VCEYAQVLHLWRRSRRIDDLEFGYVSFIINACAGA
jgi:hypothetical protein